MKMIINILLFLVCLSCSNNTSTNSKGFPQKTAPLFNIYNLDTLRSLLTKDTSEIKKLHFPPNVFLRDTTFYAENDSSWFCIACYNRTELLLIMETSLDSPDIISRIGVLSDTISGLNPIHVGSRFKDIKQYVSQIIPSYPDGYFGLKDNAYGGITYFFDTGDNYDLAIGNVSFETIPGNLTIKQILIEK